MKKQPWLLNGATDTLFILLPPFLCLLLIALFPQYFQQSNEVGIAGWVVLVLLIDVGHVYSTLYRTYFNNEALKKQKTILYTIPFLAFAAGALVYSMSAIWFWRLVAYAAVYHFIRQQYGFMRLYSRYENKESFASKLDKVITYAATLFPIIYWHISGPKNFNWFVANDFIYVNGSWLIKPLQYLYFALVIVYVLLLIKQWYNNCYFNFPKFAIIAGTIASWYFGIVYFNGDLSFTLLNVVSHGIPYMALVWVHGHKEKNKGKTNSPLLNLVFSKKGVLVFLLIVFAFAFAEEFFWDIAVWREHKTIFGGGKFSGFSLSKDLLALIVPLLAVPQLTHYIIDGFIWRIQKDEIRWNNNKS